MSNCKPEQNGQKHYAEHDIERKIKASPFGQLLDAVKKQYSTKGTWNESLQRDLPKKWEKHGNMILLSDNCFILPEWRKLGPELWKVVAHSLQCDRLGRKRRIMNDEYRTPYVELLFGPDGWVEHVDNGIKYNYDVTKCMFSIGNISEKLRIASFDCKGETIVDLFAGIGYFTLPYLVHAKASHVYACEWNPDAIEALQRNLKANKVEHMCKVLEGDCRKVCPTGLADRVNLGLLPTASPYWLTACRALKPSGGYLHIHENVSLSKLKKTTSVESSSLSCPLIDGKTNGVVILEKDERDTLESANRIEKQYSLDSIPLNDKITSDQVKSHTVDGSTESKEDALDKADCLPKRRLSETIKEEIYLLDSIMYEPLIDKHFIDQWEIIDKSYKQFAISASRKIFKYLNNLHTKRFTVYINRVGKIKSYAPQIDHVVLDLYCQPLDP